MSGCYITHVTSELNITECITHAAREFISSGAFLCHAKIRFFLICELNTLICKLQMELNGK